MILVHLLPLLVPLVIYFLVRLVLLSTSLWIMLRAQSLNYNFPGIIGTAALASLCDLIPFGGHPLAVGVLVFCVIKLTGAHIVDVRWTVFVSCALTFLFTMLIFTALPFDLKVNARGSGSSSVLSSLYHTPTAQDEEDVMPSRILATQTNSVSQPNPTNAPARVAAPAQPLATAVSNTAPAAPPAPPPLPKAIAECFTLKGVMRNGRETMVMIGTGKRTYTLRVGEKATMDTPGGQVDVELKEAGETSVLLKVRDTLLPLKIR